MTVQHILLKTYPRKETYETLAPNNILQNESTTCKHCLLTDFFSLFAKETAELL